ncbi:MAG: hsp70 family protein [Deltaproteobacteria bacterium]|nr:hsp70 family protein [Deltaproteobacteria bacterium]
MTSRRYIIGIDLGTTNSAVAYVDSQDGQRQIHSFAVPQLVNEGSIEERPALPSFLYIGGPHDVRPGALALPWDPQRTYAVGEFARLQGSRVPGRLVSSAKSWLCHGGVDREAPILPWGAPEDVQKISPVEASARYLRHFRETWLQRFPEAPLEKQDVMLTVPASFDEVARELTVEAAKLAGLERIVLLEEPQAAFYSWVHRNERDWANLLRDLHLVLVVDVGGGTTDFSLIAVRHNDGQTSLERLAVGDHLLLGGDNIDVALARMLEPQLGTKLDSQRWHALTNLCRAAKENLLGPEPPADTTIRLVGRGSSVIGGALSATLRRDEVERLVLEGFFPQTPADAFPRRDARAGLQEWGLPFANEAEVSRHLAAFLQQHRNDEVGQTWPDAMLFNGGALKPALIRERICGLLGDWSGRAPVILESVDLDLAVARGAAYYGLVRRGLGVRIGGGAARSYYIGLAATQPPADHVDAICLVRRGMEEGEELEITEPALEVIANRGVSFPLYASSTRLGDRAGELIQAQRDTLTELPPIRTVLRFGKKLTSRTLPVHVVSRLTELGTLEVWCKSLTTEHRWRLQFQLRDQSTAAAGEDVAGTHEAETVVNDDNLAAANDALRNVFPQQGSGDADPVGLVRRLEETMELGKDAWPVSAIRKLWDVLWEGRTQRGASTAHEARWLNLSGFLLRPGFGAELDEWRVQQLWRIKTEGPCFPKATQVRAEWWNMWKRLAGGLTRPQQMQLHAEVAPYLLPRLKNKTKNLPRVGPQEIREYWQLMASCERLSSEIKAELGDVLLPAIVKGSASDVEVWALGRLGARAPFHGPLNCIVARAVAEKWADTLLGCEWKRPDSTAFALVQIARCVGDRERDLDETLRHRLAERLRPLPHGTRAARLVNEAVPLEGQERARILDESLPVGLQIRSSE